MPKNNTEATLTELETQLRVEQSLLAECDEMHKRRDFPDFKSYDNAKNMILVRIVILEHIIKTK